MNTSRQFRIYNQKFTFPLKTAHGVWKRRTSLILREEKDDGEVRYGEVAPTPGFADCRLERSYARGPGMDRGESAETQTDFPFRSLVP